MNIVFQNHIVRLILLVVLVLAPVLPAYAATGAPRVFRVEGESLRGRLLLPVHFGRLGPYPFLLDLAIRHPVVDANLATSIGLPQAAVSEGTVPGPVFLARALRCGGLPPQEVLLAGVDLSALSAYLGRPVAGLWPAHQPGLEIAIDFSASRVTWTDLAASQLASMESALPMTLGEDGAPRISVQLLDRVAHSLALDISGGGRLSLSEDLLVDLGVLRGDTPRLRILGTGASAMTQCRLPALTLGGARYADLICTVVAGESAERIGLDLLRDFRVTLNYEFGLAGFERLGGAEAHDPPLSGYGILLDARREGVWTVRVAEASPAHRAGMRSGDALLAIGGQRVVGAGHDTVSTQLVAVPETLLRVTYSRGGSTARSVTLKAEVLL